MTKKTLALILICLIFYLGCSGNKYVIYHVNKEKKLLAKARKNRTIFYLNDGSSLTGYLYSVKNDSIYVSPKHIISQEEKVPSKALALKDINHVKIIEKPTISRWVLIPIGAFVFFMIKIAQGEGHLYIDNS